MASIWNADATVTEHFWHGCEVHVCAAARSVAMLLEEPLLVKEDWWEKILKWIHLGMKRSEKALSWEKNYENKFHFIWY